MNLDSSNRRRAIRPDGGRGRRGIRLKENRSSAFKGLLASFFFFFPFSFNSRRFHSQRTRNLGDGRMPLTFAQEPLTYCQGSNDLTRQLINFVFLENERYITRGRSPRLFDFLFCENERGWEDPPRRWWKRGLQTRLYRSIELHDDEEWRFPRSFESEGRGDGAVIVDPCEVRRYVSTCCDCADRSIEEFDVDRCVFGCVSTM